MNSFLFHCFMGKSMKKYFFSTRKNCGVLIRRSYIYFKMAQNFVLKIWVRSQALSHVFITTAMQEKCSLFPPTSTRLTFSFSLSSSFYSSFTSSPFSLPPPFYNQRRLEYQHAHFLIFSSLILNDGEFVMSTFGGSSSGTVKCG